MAWVGRGASLHAKVQNVLAAAVVAVLGGAFLFWYYSRVAAAPPPPAAAEQARAAQAAAQGEMALPPLGPPLGPVPVPVKAQVAVDDSALVDPTSAEGQVLLSANVGDRETPPPYGPATTSVSTSPPAVDPVPATAAGRAGADSRRGDVFGDCVV